MAEENTITTVFRADISQFSASTQQLNQYVRQVNSQFEAATAGMGKWSDNTDGLRAKIAQLNGILEADKKKLANLTEQYRKMEDAGEGNSYQATQLKIAINKQIAVIKNTEKQTENYTASLNKLEKAGVNTQQELQALTETQKKQGETAAKVAGTLGKTFVGAIAAVAAAALAAAAALVKMTTSVAKNGDEIDKESQKLGISAEAYQKLSYAMERSGADIADVTKGMREITAELAAVENGTEGAGASFTELGVDLKNVDGSMKTTEQVLLESIDALAKMENVTQRDALAQKIFGRSSQELAPLLNEGAEGVKALMQEAEDYGMIMSDDAVKASAAFEDSLQKVKGTLGGVKNTIAAALIPSFTQVTDGFADMIAGVDGGAEKMAKGITDAIENIANMTPQIMSVLGTMAQAVFDSAPAIMKALADGIRQTLPEVLKIFDHLDEVLDTAIDAAIEIAFALLDALIDILPSLVDKLLKAIIRNLPKLQKAGAELLIKLIAGIQQMIPQLIEMIPELIKMMVTTFIKEGIPQMLQIGIDMVKGLWQGLSNSFDWIKNKIKEWVGNVLAFIKKLFGIKSPSRVFRDEIGKNLALGIGEGFTKEMGTVEKNMAGVIGRITPSLQISPTVANAGGGDGIVDRLAELINAGKGGGNTVNNYSFDYKFERVQTSRLALHQAELATRRIVGG